MKQVPKMLLNNKIDLNKIKALKGKFKNQYRLTKLCKMRLIMLLERFNEERCWNKI